MEDTFKHKGMRKKLVDELEQMGISDKNVLEAFYKVPRHFFLDLAFVNQAYSNMAFQIGEGQTISHPYTVTFQTQLLQLQPKEKVLEIGTGSGFQTCVLCELGVKVFSVERQRNLFLKTKPLIQKLGYTAKLFYGDGYQGKPSFAPFDKILVTCGAPFIPTELLKQLKVGGILVIPIGEGEKQIMTKIVKHGEDDYSKEEFGDFSFVPMLKNTAK
jgi:protein-L-isoaspartate(D-aspartate) O-methyltransferase